MVLGYWRCSLQTAHIWLVGKWAHSRRTRTCNQRIFVASNFWGGISFIIIILLYCCGLLLIFCPRPKEFVMVTMFVDLLVMLHCGHGYTLQWPLCLCSAVCMYSCMIVILGLSLLFFFWSVYCFLSICLSYVHKSNLNTKRKSCHWYNSTRTRNDEVLS